MPLLWLVDELGHAATKMVARANRDQNRAREREQGKKVRQRSFGKRKIG